MKLVNCHIQLYLTVVVQDFSVSTSKACISVPKSRFFSMETKEKVFCFFFVLKGAIVNKTTLSRTTVER